MSERIKISDRFTVSRTQPTQEDFSEIQQQGFQSVVNLRTAGEDDLPLSPQEEGEIVRRLGMELGGIGDHFWHDRPERRPPRSNTRS